MEFNWQHRPWLDVHDICLDLTKMKLEMGPRRFQEYEQVLYITGQEYTALIEARECDKRMFMKEYNGEPTFFVIHGMSEIRLCPLMRFY